MLLGRMASLSGGGRGGWLGWVLLGWIWGMGLYPGNVWGEDALTRIHQAYRAGVLTRAQALNYQLDALFRPRELPALFRGDRPLPPRAASLVVLQALRHPQWLAPRNRFLLHRPFPGDPQNPGGYEAGIELCTYVSPQGHFRIHYTVDPQSRHQVPLEDSNQNGVPDYVERLAQYLETAWEQEIRQLGYDAPPSDGDLGGDCRLDVYLMDIGAYGITLYEDTPQDTYLILENDYEGFPLNLEPGCSRANQAPCQEGAMKVSAAHELFHAIQWQRSIACDLSFFQGRDLSNCWWMEATATWMENLVFPEVKDYLNYLLDPGEGWFLFPEKSLDTFDRSHQYGTMLWVSHLAEKYGPGIIHEVWETIDDAAGIRALQALQEVLEGRGTTLAAEYREFAAKNAILRTWDLPYTDGQWYPGVEAQAIDPSQGSGGSLQVVWTGQDALNPLSARYYLVLPDTTARGLTVTVDCLSGETACAHLEVLVMAFSNPPEQEADPSRDTYGVFRLPGAGGGSLVVGGYGPQTGMLHLLVAGVNTGEETVEAILRLDWGPVQPLGVQSLQILPDPARVGAGGRLQALLEAQGPTGWVIPGMPTWALEPRFSGATLQGSGFLQAPSEAPRQPLTLVATLPSIPIVDDLSVRVEASPSVAPGQGRGCVSALGSACGEAKAGLMGSGGGMIAGGGDGSGTEGPDSRCFVATAAFGTPWHPYLSVLRAFRDQVLLPHPWGRSLVQRYYAWSPPAARWIQAHPWARYGVALALLPGVAVAWGILHASLLVKGLGVCVGLGILYWGWRSRWPRGMA